MTRGPWRVGDAGHTIFGPNLGAPSPETIATVRKRTNAAVLAAAPDMLLFVELAANRIRAGEPLQDAARRLLTQIAESERRLTSS